MSQPHEPVILDAESFTVDKDAGTLTASTAAGSAFQDIPALKVDQVVFILRPANDLETAMQHHVAIGGNPATLDHNQITSIARDRDHPTTPYPNVHVPPVPGFPTDSQPDGSAVSVIIGLIEDSESKHAPFRLVAVRTTAAAIPDGLSAVPRVWQLPKHLTKGSDSPAVDYIVSTKAGTGRAEAFWEAVLRPLLDILARVLPHNTAPDRVLVTDSDESVREYARGEHTQGPRTVVLLSGDGGVVDLLNSSAQRGNVDAPPPALVLLPLGTGNALFNSLHKPLLAGPSELVTALRTLFTGVAAPLPTFRASFSEGSRIVKYTSKEAASGDASAPEEDPAAAAAQLYRQETDVSLLYGSIVASYGFHASIVYESDTPEYRAHGSARFSMVAQELLKESHEYDAQIDIRRAGSSDLERVPRTKHAYVLSTMVSNLERTFTISPRSRPLDGKLWLVHFAPVGAERAMEAMMKAYDGGKHVDVEWDDGERVYYDDIEELRVQIRDEDPRWRKVCIDGTIVEIPKGGTLVVEKKAFCPFNVVVAAEIQQAAPNI